VRFVRSAGFREGNGSTNLGEMVTDPLKGVDKTLICFARLKGRAETEKTPVRRKIVGTLSKNGLGERARGPVRDWGAVRGTLDFSCPKAAAIPSAPNSQKCQVCGLGEGGKRGGSLSHRERKKQKGGGKER